jgi:ribose 1,5-bisphosphokinase
MSGRFIAIVGPSGVGKDSVMQALAAKDARLVLARRVITRPTDAGGEVFDGVSLAEFNARQESGDFALSWGAHDLQYGIPASVDSQLAAGRDVLANLSRTALAVARVRFSNFDAVLLTAPREVLAERLSARGRESADDIFRRLERGDWAVATDISVHVVDNGGTLDDTVNAVLASLYPVSA